MKRCFDTGVPKLSSSDKIYAKRNRVIFQGFSDDVETDLDSVNQRNHSIKVSDSNQVIFNNQTIQLQYIKGLYEDALECGGDASCVYVDKEGDGYGRENRITDLYQSLYTVQDTSGVSIDVSGLIADKLTYTSPLGAYYDIGCDRISNYLNYTTISGEPSDRDNFNFKFPLSLHVE